MTFDAHLDIRIVPQDLGNRRENGVAFRQNLDAPGPEFDLFDDLDLACLDPCLGTAVLLGVFVLRPRCVGARVLRIDDAVLVTVRWKRRASVGLRVVGLDAGRVGAGVVRIRNAIIVAVGGRRRASVGLGVVGLDAGRVGAGVVRIENAVVVAVRGSRWASVGFGVV